MGRNVNLFKRIRPVACSLIMAAVLLAATSCEELRRSQAVQFKVELREPAETKASYSGVIENVTTSDGTKKIERIDWTVGDLIRIYSDKAVRSEDNTYHWADYRVESVSASGAVSLATITYASANGGLVWQEGGGKHTFIGIYPSPGLSSPDEPEIGANKRIFLNAEIPHEQTGALSNKKVYGVADTDIIYPSDATMYMTAYAADQTESSATISFEPAFTAFHINAGTDKNMIIKSVQLIAASNPVSGAFTGLADDGPWGYTVYSGPSTYTDVTLDLSSISSDGGYVLTAGQTVDMVLLAMPTDLTGLTLKFNVEIDGVDAVRQLDLKVSEATTLYGHTLAAGASIIFNARKQAYLKGLLVPGTVWTIDGTTDIIMRESVSDWIDDPANIIYGPDSIISAYGLDQNSATDYVFSIFAPEGKTWKIKVLDSSSQVATGVTITQQDIAPAVNSGNGELSGTIGDPARIHFTLSGTGGPYTLSFSVIIDGREYSINSEVVRGDGSGNGFQNGSYTPITF